MLTSLVLEKRIVTTEAKAKYVKPLADKLLLAAIGADGTTKRRLAAQFTNKQAAKELFEVVVPKLPKTRGSLVRIIKLSPRLGDKADQAALVISKQAEPTAKKTKETKETKDVK